MKWHDIVLKKWALIALTVSIVAVSFSGCKTKYVTVPEYHTEYICKADTFAKTDSVFLKDSVYVYQQGDTVYYNKVSYRDQRHNIYRVKADTIIKRDSISVPYPVERQLSKNEQRLISLGRFFVVFLFLAVIAIVFTLFYHNKKC